MVILYFILSYFSETAYAEDPMDGMIPYGYERSKSTDSNLVATKYRTDDVAQKYYAIYDLVLFDFADSSSGSKSNDEITANSNIGGFVIAQSEGVDETAVVLEAKQDAQSRLSNYLKCNGINYINYYADKPEISIKDNHTFITQVYHILSYNSDPIYCDTIERSYKSKSFTYCKTESGDILEIFGYDMYNYAERKRSVRLSKIMVNHEPHFTASVDGGEELRVTVLNWPMSCSLK